MFGLIFGPYIIVKLKKFGEGKDTNNADNFLCNKSLKLINKSYAYTILSDNLSTDISYTFPGITSC